MKRNERKTERKKKKGKIIAKKSSFVTYIIFLQI